MMYWPFCAIIKKEDVTVGHDFIMLSKINVLEGSLVSRIYYYYSKTVSIVKITK
jgi:hypothetical protein